MTASGEVLPYLLPGRLEPVEGDSYQSLDDLMQAKLRLGATQFNIEGFEQCKVTCWSTDPEQLIYIEQILHCESMEQPVIQGHPGKIVTFFFPGVVKKNSKAGKSGFRIRSGTAYLNFEALAHVTESYQIAGGGELLKKQIRA